MAAQLTAIATELALAVLQQKAKAYLDDLFGTGPPDFGELIGAAVQEICERVGWMLDQQRLDMALSATQNVQNEFGQYLNAPTWGRLEILTGNAAAAWMELTRMGPQAHHPLVFNTSLRIALVAERARMHKEGGDEVKYRGELQNIDDIEAMAAPRVLDFERTMDSWRKRRVVEFPNSVVIQTGPNAGMRSAFWAFELDGVPHTNPEWNLLVSNGQPYSPPASYTDAVAKARKKVRREVDRVYIEPSMKTRELWRKIADAG